jgi:hypothetical protein
MHALPLLLITVTLSTTQLNAVHLKHCVLCSQVAELSSCIDVIVTWDQTAPHRPLHWLLFGKTLLMGTGGHASSSSGAGKATSSNSAPSAAEVQFELSC